MKQWIKRVLRRWLEIDEPRVCESVAQGYGPSVGAIPSSFGLGFTIYNANGGQVVDCKRYDRKSDRYYNTLYVMHSDQDLASEVAKIITLETLKG